jgi:hypothetical protein
MRRGAIQVVIIFLHILTVVALGTAQTKQALFEDWIAPVPQGYCQAYILEAIAKSAQPVLIPAIGATAGVVVWEVVPDIPVGAVVLADRTPGALTQVRPPVLLISIAGSAICQAFVFGSQFFCHATLSEKMF